MLKNVSALAAALSVAACASTPDVAVTYYLPKSSLGVTVVRTLGCDEEGRITALTSVVGDLSYSRGEAKTLQMKRLDDWFADTSTELTFYGDGRLAGINSEQGGQGGEIVKSAVALSQAASGTALFGAAGAAAALKGKAPLKPVLSKACQTIRRLGPKDGVPLKFQASTAFADGAGRTAFAAGGETGALLAQFPELTPVAGLPCLQVDAVRASPPPLKLSEGDKVRSNKVLVRLREPASADVSVWIQDADPLTVATCDQKVWTSTFAVPQLGAEYDVPVLRPAPFGKQTFGLGLAESGAVTRIKYGKDVGLTSSMSAATSVLGAQTVETESAAAARLKAEADVIYQHQRLMTCRLDPAACKV